MLERLDLYAAVRAVKLGLPFSIHNVFRILECHNPEMCNFFTPVREIVMVMHEMHEETGQPERDYPYNEFVPNK